MPRYSRAGHQPCSGCHRGRNGTSFVNVRWLYAHRPEWEYYCDPCRTLLILAGDDKPMYDLGDF